MARLPRRSGHDRAGSLSLAFLDFPVQHLRGVRLTGSEGERPAAAPAASGGLLPSGRRAAVRRVEIDAEDVREIAGEDVVPRRGVRQRHVADDQVIGVDVPQAEEQLGTLVEAAADAVEHGGRVLAHHRPVGTVASEGNLAESRVARRRAAQ